MGLIEEESLEAPKRDSEKFLSSRSSGCCCSGEHRLLYVAGEHSFFFHTLFLYSFVNPFFCFQALQKAVDAHEENLLWLKTRLNVLSEVSSEVEVQRQRTALAKLSTDLRALFSTLHQVHFRQLLYIYKRVFCTDFAI